MKNPDFIKQTITPLLEKREKDLIEIEENAKSEFRELVGFFVVISFVALGIVYWQTHGFTDDDSYSKTQINLVQKV